MLWQSIDCTIQTHIRGKELRETRSRKNLSYRERYGKSSFDVQAAKQLTDLEDSSYTALLQFLKAKLLHEPEIRKHHRKYLAACKREHHAAVFAFWRISIYLPNFIFRPAVSTMLGQGALKQFISRLRKLV
jgi:hypothetical protein